MAAKVSSLTATRFHCIKCGRIWGDGSDVGSSGLCIHCFAEWAIKKFPCFGTEDCLDVDGCSVYKYCKEYYGIKQDLSR